MKNEVVRVARNIDELIEIIVFTLNECVMDILKVEGGVIHHQTDGAGTTTFNIQYNLSKQNGSRRPIAKLEQYTVRDPDEKYKYKPEDTIESNLNYIIKKLEEKTNSVKTRRINTSLYIKPHS